MKQKLSTGILSCGGHLDYPLGQPENPPICYSTAYYFEDLNAYDEINSERSKGYFYSRVQNPNRDCLADALNYLEGSENSLLFPSGMAAISTALMTFAHQGDHVLACREIYGETVDLLDGLLVNFGIEVTYVDFTDLEQVKAAIRPNTTVFYAEVVSNPLMHVVDIWAVSRLAKSRGIRFLVDNTFMTPIAIRPLDFGADVVIHSLTKFINGHSDVCAGAVLGSAETIKLILRTQMHLGCILDPNSSWMVLRSIRTLNLRMERAMRNAQFLAEQLEKDIHVRQVNYPGLSNHPQHELAKRIFSNGNGAILSFLVENNYEKVNQFVRSLNHIRYLGSLGGYSTTLTHPATSFRYEFSPEKLLEMVMEEGLIRISTGIEDPEDLWMELREGLKIFDPVR